MARSTLASVAAGLLLIGCGAAQDADVDAGDAAPVGEARSALCTDNGAANYSAVLGSSEGSSVSRTSPTRTYGSAACQGLYVVEATATQGKSFNMSATWGEALPNTQQACPFALLVADAYGYKNGQWYSLGHKTAGGVWGGFGTGSCEISVGWSQTNSQYSKIRIATKAAAFLIFSSDARKVSATFQIPVVPR